LFDLVGLFDIIWRLVILWWLNIFFGRLELFGYKWFE